MKNIIKKIFINKEYIEEENISTDEILFFRKENQEYFLVVEYDKDQILEFFKSDKTNNVINFFDKIKKQKSDIQKNTSLIILLNLGGKELKKELNNKDLKNQIFKIEEDEYFFRKYVITYTNNSTSNLSDFKFTEEELSKKIEESGKFKQFQENNYLSDEYFLIMQLFVKLPFLKFNIEQGGPEYKTIEEILDKEIEDREIRIAGIKEKLDSLENDNSVYKDEFFDNFNIDNNEN